MTLLFPFAVTFGILGHLFFVFRTVTVLTVRRKEGNERVIKLGDGVKRKSPQIRSRTIMASASEAKEKTRALCTGENYPPGAKKTYSGATPPPCVCATVVK